jgi:hypothetical protein
MPQIRCGEWVDMTALFLLRNSILTEIGVNVSDYFR